MVHDEVKPEGSPFADFAGNTDLTAMLFIDDISHNRKSQTRAFERMDSVFDPEETLENIDLIFGIDADSGVADFNANERRSSGDVALMREIGSHRNLTTGRRKFHGISD